MKPLRFLREATVRCALYALALYACSFALARAEDDPYLWLEDVESTRALDWVKARNAESKVALESASGFSALRSRLLAIYDSNERIPYVDEIGNQYYNFWRDAEHTHGIWRRTSPVEYRKANPKWETVLDLDALSKADNISWVWKGADCLHPTYDRCLLKLSRGGGDAVVVREFDLRTKNFVADGFTLPEAKSDVAWQDRDHLYVGTDFGADSLTTSGYPRIVKRWQRGTPLNSAEVVFTGATSDVATAAWVSEEPGFHREFITRSLTAFTGETYLRRDDQWQKLELPTDVDARPYREWLLVQLRHDWMPRRISYKAGSLLAIRFEDFLAGKREFDVLFAPTARSTLSDFTATRNYLILNVLDNIHSKLYSLRNQKGQWRRDELATPAFGIASVSAVDPFTSDEYFYAVTDFLTPTSLHLGVVGKRDRTLLKQLPSFFASDGLTISQHEAKSKDGTRIPYFQVARKDLKLDGSNPTLLTGYGGFEIARTPSYSGGIGAGWLERGGVYVLANIRGGGEFGPAWHQAAQREKRQNAYDDFIAIAEDLIARKVTSANHLGILGGSNGGLLVGVMLTQRPDLFGAIVCQAPLLDMRRYHKLLAGASWMGEYGDPDNADDWAFISKYSPYQNVTKDKSYPPILFTTSTRDDRVHPGHARKMAARMMEQGHTMLFYENIEGGHAGAADNAQQAYMNALAFTFLWKTLQ